MAHIDLALLSKVYLNNVMLDEERAAALMQMGKHQQPLDERRQYFLFSFIKKIYLGSNCVYV